MKTELRFHLLPVHQISITNYFEPLFILSSTRNVISILSSKYKTTELDLSNTNFIVSEFDLYDYLLNKEQQRKRNVIRYLPDKTTSITTHLESSLFVLYEKDYHSLDNKVIISLEA